MPGPAARRDRAAPPPLPVTAGDGRQGRTEKQPALPPEHRLSFYAVAFTAVAFSFTSFR
jgi:hypothetical protein